MSFTLNSLEDVKALAREIGMVTTQEAITYGENLAIEICQKAGITVTRTPATAQPTAETSAAAEPEKPADEAVEKPADQTPSKPQRNKREKSAAKETPAADAPKDAFLEEMDKLEKHPGAAKTEEPAKALTTEDAKAALRNLAVKKDMDACRAVLDKFGVPKVGEVPADRIAEFIKACDDKAAE